ncbi:MAG: ROK family transcriptional regulator [Gemmatimonadota bacterium]|jgi:predicted NBD/HSP70 family sugar kinase
MTRGTKTATGPAGRDQAEGRPLTDLVLEFIWHHEQASRAEVARGLSLSRSTASEIVGDLLETGLVAEAGDGPSRGGRRPVLLEFQDSAHGILGVDMGASHVSVALTDLRAKVLAWHRRDHPVRADPEGTRGLILDLCDAALRDAPGIRDRLVGIGVAVPSPVDPARPSRLPATVMPAWEGRTGFHVLTERFGVPIFVDNDANLGALAEHWWGGARGLGDFTYVKLGTGIGSGHMIRGEIYRGFSSVAGEIGHLGIDPTGPPCLCGNRGCLTTFAGTPALLARAEALLAEYPESPLAGSSVTLEALEDAALADDPLALQVVAEAADYLGTAIAGVLNLMNPGAVILGGSLTRVGDRLFVPLREAALRRTLVSSMASSEIRASELGPRAFALGAATQVLDAALHDPSLFPGMART